MPGTFGTAVLIGPPPLVMAIQGSSITLNCTATLPLLSTDQCEPENCGIISWIRGTDPTESSSERMFKNALLTITSQLKLSSITTSADAGIYTCHLQVSNDGAGAVATVLKVYS